MSLWHESLALELADIGDDLQKRAVCILYYLSMPTPRSWWEQALWADHVDKPHASLLRNLLGELSKAVNVGGDTGYEVLVSLPFVHDLTGDSGMKELNTKSVSYYIIEAKKVLAERPDLLRLARLIENVAE